jgi:hypothetical protein
MCKVIFLLITILSFPNILCAADPIIGTWKLNIAKSNLPPELFNVKELSFTIREMGDNYELITKGINKDDTQFYEKMICPKQGGFRDYEGGNPAEGISVLDFPIDDRGNGYCIRLLNGRVISVTQWILSEDGRTWRAIGKASTLEGKPYEGPQWWEKQ